MKPLVYVAGPYSGDPITNTRNAVEVAERVERVGCDVVIPHLSLLWDLISPAPYSRWLERDNVLLVRCDAVFRFGGASSGADAEVELAHAEKIPVFTGLTELRTWVEKRP